MAEELKPPRKSVELEDSGAHEPDIVESSDESFTDASEGHKSIPSRSGGASPIPITRVERVDEEPAYGEVPGTVAYKLRTADAVPDEVEVVPQGGRSRSQSRLSASDLPSSQPSSRRPSIPKMVVEKVDPDVPSYGDIPGTAAFELRKADAEPDEVIRSPISPPSPDPWNGSPTAHTSRSPPLPAPRDEEVDHPHSKQFSDYDPDEDDDKAGEDADAGFGDDFDDFEEGQAGGDDDFGDFGEGFEGEEADFGDQPPTPPPVPIQIPSFPILDYGPLKDPSAIREASRLHLQALFPSTPLDLSSEPSKLPTPNPQIFQSDRSHSLYTQLIAPPPLAPPDWLRSRIRRLFLVSLGVPVDLDEILPASKQKKLILPSIHGQDGENADSGARARTAESGAVSRLKSGNDSSASLDSKSAPSKRRSHRSEAEAPTLDLAETTRIAGTTEAKMQGMSDEELKSHVADLDRLLKDAENLWAWWRTRVEGAVKEKEAFEGVIENLVKHARKVRK